MESRKRRLPASVLLSGVEVGQEKKAATRESRTDRKAFAAIKHKSEYLMAVSLYYEVELLQ